VLTAELPVSHWRVSVREPSGVEDMLLAEAWACDARLALALAAAVAEPADGMLIDWPALPITDLDVLVLHIRQALFGDDIRATPTCPATGCAELMEIRLGIAAYVAHHESTIPEGVEASEPEGWFALPEQGIAFRAPTAGDFADVAALPDAAGELARRCLRPADAPEAARRTAERALESIAPDLAGELDAVCPECGTPLTLPFDPLRFCLHELRQQAGSVVEDVHLLAGSYRWGEAEILALPRRRRMAYADLVRDDVRRAV
jgi:hypothetical protein